MTLPVTIHFTEEQANALFDLLDWASTDIECRLPDCEDDPELAAIWRPMFDIAQTAIEKIEATITENHIMGKPGACPRCGQDNSKAPFLLEQTGSDAHCDHEVEHNYSCDNCGCRFDEVWMYSHKQVTRDPRDFTPAEVEKWGNDTERTS